MKLSKRNLVSVFLLALSVGTANLVLGLASAHAQSGMASARALPDFADLVEQVGPSVVNIRTLEKSRSASGGGAAEDEMQEFFRRFFGVPLPNAPRQPGPRSGRPQEEDARPRGVGSGFILSADGYIMTNAHVVEDADEVLVTLTDKREFKARIVGADKRTDVALVKIESSGLPAVKIGDVGRLRAGEWVVAIGSPFGLDNTVTAGIVSAKQRDTGEYLPFIQTDVAINPGNSGGPLINLRGEVVGINSQIYSRSGGYMGIAFAIPIDEAMRVGEQLKSSGRVTRGRIGVQIDQVSKDIAESIGLGRPHGALVRGVESGSPAEKGGLEAGDIITKLDGRNIEKASDLPRLVGNTKPGTGSTLTVFRRGKTQELVVTIGEVEGEKQARKVPERDDKNRPNPAGQAWGLTLSDLSDTQKKELRIKGGVRIEAVSDIAARSGLREGDVIVQVANNEIGSLKDFEAIASRLDRGKPVHLLIRRGEWAQFILLKPGR